MALILCIDSSTTHASVALIADGQVIAIKSNQQQKEHAAFIQPAIQELMLEMHLSLNQLNAIAVSAGPGSYTGLRVGFASAKGLCYALQIPLITIPTTEIMASAVLSNIPDELKAKPTLSLCAMIDARRMEVFSAVYSTTLQIIQPIAPVILDAESYTERLSAGPVCFFGDGAPKWQKICQHPNAFFPALNWNAADMLVPAFERFQQEVFTSLAYAVPEYGKEFHSPGN